MKKNRFLVLALVFIMLFSVNVSGASYYSYKNVGLDYGKSSDGFYGAGKKGYKWVMVTSVKGSRIRYRYAKFSYDDYIGHCVIKPYGKTYTANLTKSTKYYKSAPWQRMRSLKAYNYSYHSAKFKKLKILVKTNKSTMFGRNSYYSNSRFYIKVSKGKIKTVVSPAVFAI